MYTSIFSHINALNKAMDASWYRTQVINNNIANVNTPGFKASTVEFEDILKSKLADSAVSMKHTSVKHMTPETQFAPRLVRRDNTVMTMDGNNVDIDAEATELAKNTIYYNHLATKTIEEFGRLKSVLTETK